MNKNIKILLTSVIFSDIIGIVSIILGKMANINNDSLFILGILSTLITYFFFIARFESD